MHFRQSSFGVWAFVALALNQFSCASQRTQLAPLCLAQPPAQTMVANAPVPRSAPAVVASPEFLRRWSSTQRFTLGNPYAITVVPDGNAALFLRAAAPSATRNLYAIDRSTRQERLLLSATDLVASGEEQLSVEERARRERQRQSGRGITSYLLSPDGRTLLVPFSGKLYLVDRATKSCRELPTLQTAPAVDPRWSPNGRLIAAVRGGELFVTDVQSGRETRLSQPAGAGISHATAEFVAQEEMDRMQGYWWAPDSSAIVYQETDERAVEQLTISDPTTPEQAGEPFRYPRAGRANAIVKLGIVPVTGGATRWIDWDHSALEYVTRVSWQADSPLTLVLQNRRQTEVAVLTVNPATARTTLVHRETDTAWVNLDEHVPVWLAHGTKFLWTTERDGFTALELRAADGSLSSTLTAESAHFRALLKVDPREQFVYFSGGEDSSQTQVFRLSITPGASGGPARPEPVSTTAGEHDYVFSSDASVRVHVEQHIDARRSWTFEQADGTAIAPIASVAEQPAEQPTVQMTTLGDSHFRAAIIRPHNFDPTQQYAVIDAIYGGPGTRTVTHARERYVLHQWIADNGFIVVAIDTRGTPFRGRAWERALKGQMGSLPLTEHREAIRALGAQLRAVDLSRVGVYGWSYGGYLSALALQQTPGFFRAAVAGAPVTDWRDYDTHYTERYLGLPAEQAASYDGNSVLTSVGAASGPLLLIHGTADDNVYFMHSLKLMNALLRAQRAVEFFPLMGMTHSPSDPELNRLVYDRTARFFREHLYRDRM
jgi:dipeptidyl-peptidase-4